MVLPFFGYGPYNQSVDVCLSIAIPGKIPRRGRTYDIPIISSDALNIQLSYRKLIGATPLHALGSDHKYLTIPLRLKLSKYAILHVYYKIKREC